MSISSRQRVKTGCLTCRKGHRKCDETKPICQHCFKRSIHCVWPAQGDVFRIQKGIQTPNNSRVSKRNNRSSKNQTDTSYISYGQITNHTDLSSNGPISIESSNSSDSIIDPGPRDISEISVLYQSFRNPQSPGGAHGSPLNLRMLLNEPSNNNNNNNNNSNNNNNANNRHVQRQQVQQPIQQPVQQVQPQQNPNLSMATPTSQHDRSLAVHQEVPNFEDAQIIYSQDTSTMETSSTRNESLSLENDSPKYLTLRNTLRDYMFLNAFTTNPSSPTFIQDYFKNGGNVMFEDHLLELNNTMSEFEKNFQTGNNGGNSNNNSSISLNGEVGALMDWTVSPTDKMELLTRYITEVAPWLDMFDHRGHFTSKLPLMVKSDYLLYSILTIASRQEDKVLHKQGNSTERTFRLYERALHYLVPKVKQIPDTGMVASCVILCCFEMMSSSNPSKTWRKHLEGCAALFKVSGITGFSGGLEQAIFWCFARMDVMHAISGKRDTIIPCEKWLPVGSVVHNAREYFTNPSFDWHTACDMYANYIVFLLAGICNIIYSRSIPPSDFEQEWRFFYLELNNWWSQRNEGMLPVDIVWSTDEQKSFPEILYCNSPAISGNQMFHTAFILLMEHKPRFFENSLSLEPHPISPIMTKGVIWHAKQIVGISLANEHHGCWNNALQPLWTAGKLMSHKEEHQVILELLNKIEKATGWSMSWRSRDLQEHWNN